LAPQSVDVLAGLAELRDRQGRGAEALQVYLSLAAATSDQQWNLRAGELLLRLGRPADALPLLESAQGSAPKDANLRRLLAEAMLGVGRTLEGATMLEEVLHADPRNPDAQFSLAYAFYRQGRIHESMGLLRPLTDEPRKGPSAKNLTAWILATHPEEKYRDAVKAVELAEDVWKQQGGKDPSVLDTLAAAYANAGRCADAAAVQLRCLQLMGPTAPADRLARARERIELYRAERPYREEPQGAKVERK
jgi:tetratricopeptide (TPR) repeat protein